MQNNINSPLHDRLNAAAAGRTYRHLSELTGTHHETVRRYMQGTSPSAEFIAAFCVNLGINPEWLLTGRGPMKSGDVRTHVLKSSSPTELLSAMAGTLEKLAERVDRLELFVQTLETRLRGSMPPPAGGSAGIGGTGSTGALVEHKLVDHEQAHAAAHPVRQRAQRIADAVPQRPREDAR